MQVEKKIISKELIIETTLRLIEENEGLKDVNLRGIAKEIGCAHTNLYNYFYDFNDILWEALGQALLKMMTCVDSNLESELNADHIVLSIFSSTINFSLDHPGWFRLIWLEKIGGKPSKEVVQILFRPGEALNETLRKASDNNLSREQAETIGDILHNYVHGELCKWINARSFMTSAEETRLKLVSNLKLLYGLLMNKDMKD